MSILTATILRYSLAALGVITSSVVPLVYSSRSKVSTTKEGGAAQQITNEKGADIKKKGAATVAVSSKISVQKIDSPLVNKENQNTSRQTLIELKDKLKKKEGQRIMVQSEKDLRVEPSPVNLEEQEKVYREFLSSIQNIFRSTVWVDEKFGTPWLAQVSTNVPIDKLEDIKENVQISSELKDYLTSTIDLSITGADVQIIKSGDKNNSVWDKRETMVELMNRFCYSSNWKKLQDKIDLQPILCSFGGISSIKIKNHRDVNVLTFVRKENEQLYFLDIFFNTNRESYNSLLIQYVSYKDKSWWSSGWYQANGDYDNSRRHIGGNINKDSKLGYSVTEIDRELSSMFEVKDTSSVTLYKLITSVSECLLDEECSILFHRELGDYQELSHRDPGISKSDSWDPEKYKYIHPFSRKYWNIDKKVKLNPLLYRQFLNFQTKKKT